MHDDWGNFFDNYFDYESDRGSYFYELSLKEHGFEKQTEKTRYSSKKCVEIGLYIYSIWEIIISS